MMFRGAEKEARNRRAENPQAGETPPGGAPMQLRTSLVWEACVIALQSILAHKLRTFLTLLGIIIGVASVMVVGASIQGLQTYVMEVVSKTLGSDSFAVTKFAQFGNVTDEQWERMLRRNKDLTLEDVEFLRRFCTACAEITGELSGSQTVYHGSERIYGTAVNGVTANIMNLGNLTLADGRSFIDHEERHRRLVCVIGWEVKETLFPAVDAVGQEVKIRNVPLTVVGVLEKVGTSFGMSLDNTLYMPITTYQKLFGSRRSITIRGRANSREDFETALDQVRVGMRIRHQLKPDEEDDFGLISTEEINTEVDRFTGAVAMVVIPITLISLVVGGIVIMNIMLVTVTERTFEVGLRKALGARRKDILRQFLVESFILASLGGVLGLSLAWGVSWLIEATTPVTMTITMGYVLLSVGVSGGIGIVFGIYPALKAARLDPIVALGSER